MMLHVDNHEWNVLSSVCTVPPLTFHSAERAHAQSDSNGKIVVYIPKEWLSVASGSQWQSMAVDRSVE